MPTPSTARHSISVCALVTRHSAAVNSLAPSAERSAAFWYTACTLLLFVAFSAAELAVRFVEKFADAKLGPKFVPLRVITGWLTSCADGIVGCTRKSPETDMI